MAFIMHWNFVVLEQHETKNNIIKRKPNKMLNKVKHYQLLFDNTHLVVMADKNK